MQDEFICPDWPQPSGVRSLQTTRIGGVSPPPWESFNLGSHVGDAPRNVAQNRARLGARLPTEPCWLEQVHGSCVLDLDCVAGGRSERDGERLGNAPRHDMPQADAAVSRVPGRVCAILTADCLPVLFCDLDATVVAAAHAGWRGLCAGVLENTVRAMRVDSGKIMAWLGPAIGPAAFEVGEEVRAAFLAQDPHAAHAFRALGAGKFLSDLHALARRRLAACGVVRVFGIAACTVTDPARFFSYRRDGRTGRMASLIWLAEER
ncbi:MAG: peptidoglycan editing factor PgeF [Zoogloeaceae bacterium]|jgi:YfiH family protein|nr:peptidoglycan editing factor PgeF [Zoogloeaceae bacterium]